MTGHAVVSILPSGLKLHKESVYKASLGKAISRVRENIPNNLIAGPVSINLGKFDGVYFEIYVNSRTKAPLVVTAVWEDIKPGKFILLAGERLDFISETAVYKTESELMSAALKQSITRIVQIIRIEPSLFVLCNHRKWVDTYAPDGIVIVT